MQDVDIGENEVTISINPYPVLDTQEREADIMPLSLPPVSEENQESATAEQMTQPAPVPVVPPPVTHVMKTTAPQSVTGAPMMATPLGSPAVPETFNPVEGFGSDMPLALALRQVAPPNYAFAFGNGVNPGYRVTWNGGKPWNEVVTEMVQPLNFRAQIHNNTIYITPAGAS
jgi:hypothetical protein